MLYRYIYPLAGIIYEQIPYGSTVLEIGCADGRLANMLSIKKKCKVYCVEKDPSMAIIVKGNGVDIQEYRYRKNTTSFQ